MPSGCAPSLRLIDSRLLHMWSKDVCGILCPAQETWLDVSCRSCTLNRCCSYLAADA
jgi:hypothetical protein